MRVVPLHYTAGADEALDRPAHVRAGSGIAWVDDRLAVVQDDANFIALVDPRTGDVVALPLAAGRDGRRQFGDASGNKAHKSDLEAVVGIPGPLGGTQVVAFGSGSTPERERVVMFDGTSRRDAVDRVHVTERPVPDLYARLRAAVDFTGSELNVEGVTYLEDEEGGHLRFFNRGNGAPRHEVGPVNATCDIGWSALVAHLDGEVEPLSVVPRNVVQYDLGSIGGLPLTFTDASVVGPVHGRGGDRILYTAAAEASPDATRDGPVAGCAIGIIEETRVGVRVRWTLLHDGSGEPFDGKVEGIARDPHHPTRAFVVVDRDASEAPSELCEVDLCGEWFTTAK